MTVTFIVTCSRSNIDKKRSSASNLTCCLKWKRSIFLCCIVRETCLWIFSGNILNYRQIEELTQYINKTEMTINDLCDENEDLRGRLNLDPRKPLDLTKFRSDKAVRKEEEKAMNYILQKEVRFYISLHGFLELNGIWIWLKLSYYKKFSLIFYDIGSAAFL